MKVLVTGVAGAIGSVLADKLIEQGHEVNGIDNFFAGNPKNVNEKVNFTQCDVRAMPPSVFEGVEVVFHLAALTKLEPSLANPIEYHDVNVSATICLLKLAKEHGINRFVFASSSAVYGHRENSPEDETLMPMPINPYGTTKLIGEEYLKCWTRSFELDTVSLRFFNVFGARENEESEYACLITKFFKLKREGKPLTICGNGNQRFDFVYVGDVVDAIIKAGFANRRMCGETINIGTGVNHSINEIAKMIGGDTEWIATRPSDVTWTLADNSKAFAYLGWEPTIKLEDYINDHQS